MFCEYGETPEKAPDVVVFSCIAAKLTPLIRYSNLRCCHLIAKVNVSLGNAVFDDQDLKLPRENIGQV